MLLNLHFLWIYKNPKVINILRIKFSLIISKPLKSATIFSYEIFRLKFDHKTKFCQYKVALGLEYAKHFPSTILAAWCYHLQQRQPHNNKKRSDSIVLDYFCTRDLSTLLWPKIYDQWKFYVRCSVWLGVFFYPTGDKKTS